MGHNEIYIRIGVAAISTILSLSLACKMNESLQKKQIEARSYIWGYFIGWMGIFIWGSQSILLVMTHNDPQVILLGCILIAPAIVHFYIIKRRKWAWVVGTILHLNPVIWITPIIWIINGIYMKNRWGELSNDFPIPIKRILLMVVNLFNKSPVVRASIVGSIFWASVVLAYVFMFEPYGRRILDHEWWLTVKIIIFPPMVAIIGYALYVKVIKKRG